MPRPALVQLLLILLLAGAASFLAGVHALPHAHGCTDTSSPAFRCGHPHPSPFCADTPPAPIDLLLVLSEAEIELARTVSSEAPLIRASIPPPAIRPAALWPPSKGPPTLLRLRCSLTT